MICRGLIHEPKILILDEPTAGVDIELRHSMWSFLKEINENGTTIILTTHYLEEVEFLCNGVVIINNGKLLVDTTVKSLLKKITIQKFILELKNPIKNVPISDKFIFYQIDNLTLEVSISNFSTLNDLFIFLNNNKIYIDSIRNKSNRLEELFINLIKSS